MPIDLPPLLRPGIHPLTLTALHVLAVEDKRFNLSKTRHEIMRNVWTICACLSKWGVGEEIWVDGSFLTEKIDPGDIDLVLVIQENFADIATAEQLAIWDWWDDVDEADPQKLLQCHTFTVAKIPPGDPGHVLYVKSDQSWRRWFGTSRDGDPKGIGRILLPDGCI